MSYIGKCKKCQKIIAAVVDIPGREKETAKDVAEFIKDGLQIERASCDYVRKNFSYCECNKDKQIKMFK